MWITNEGKRPFAYRWMGVDHVLDAGTSEEIDEAAARNVFGYGSDDKRPNLIRHGLMRHSSEYESIKHFFDAFIFTQEKPVPRKGRPLKDSAVPSPSADAGK